MARAAFVNSRAPFRAPAMADLIGLFTVVVTSPAGVGTYKNITGRSPFDACVRLSARVQIPTGGVVTATRQDGRA